MKEKPIQKRLDEALRKIEVLEQRNQFLERQNSFSDKVIERQDKEYNRLQEQFMFVCQDNGLLREETNAYRKKGLKKR